MSTLGNFPQSGEEKIVPGLKTLEKDFISISN
jgi:hypothetical protein